MKKYILGLILVMSFAFISASFQVGTPNGDIEQSYPPEGNIRGWINVSLANEPVLSAITDGSGKSISLIDLIQKSKNINFE